MVWGYRPDDSLATQQLPQMPGTIPHRVVTDADLADANPTRTLAELPPAKHSHRKPRGWQTRHPTVVAAAALSVVAFAGVWVFLASQEPAGPAAVRQAAPEAPVKASSPTPRPTVKHPVVRPAEPVVRQQDRPALPVKPSPVHTVVVTITAKPKATPTPKPPSSSPKPTAIPTPDTTSPGPVETANPDEETTPDTEATDGDS